MRPCDKRPHGLSPANPQLAGIDVRRTCELKPFVQDSEQAGEACAFYIVTRAPGSVMKLCPSRHLLHDRNRQTFLSLTSRKNDSRADRCGRKNTFPLLPFCFAWLQQCCSTCQFITRLYKHPHSHLQSCRLICRSPEAVEPGQNPH